MLFAERVAVYCESHTERTDTARTSQETPNTSSGAITLGLTQILTEMSLSNLPGNKARPTLKADSLAAICEAIV
jgi:hypothetical protein